MSLTKLTEHQNYTYQWSPSNGLSSTTIAEPIANPTQTTSYSVTITDKIRGCTGVGNVVIKVNLLPVAICDIDKTICSGDSVNLILNVKGGTSAYNYLWYPSNSLNRSDIQSPIAKPLNSITYSCLATDKNGCTTSCDIGINVNSKPSVPSNDVSICSGNNVTLNAAATGNGPFIYSWSPASGLSNPNISNPIVSLTQSTTYIVTVTDKNQCMSTEAVKIDIVSAPVVNFSYKNNNWCTPINVSFISNVFPKGNYIYSWDLSDGQISNLQNPQKIFTNNTNTDKQYTIKLTVNAGMNCNISKEKVITIHPRPEADFDFSTKNTCPPAKINIINNSISSGNTTYSWSVLNNSSVTISNSTAKEPILTFTDNQSDSDSIYYVRFIVFNGDKCSDTLIKSIKIYKRPRANFNIDSALCPGIPLFPKNLSESAIKYLWSIVPSNNVIISDKSGLNPIINFPENLTGNNLKYNISLLVTSDNGCKDSTERKFSSYSKPIISFTKNISEGCSPLEVITCNTSKDPNIRSYYWKHYNGSTDSKLQDTMIFYNNLINDIIFPVKLIAVSNNNCRDSLQQTVKVHSNSKALFSPAKFYNCSPFKIDSTILNLKTFNINSDYYWTIFDSKYKVINQFTGTSFPGYTINKESDTIYIRLVTTSKYNCLNDTLIKRFTTLKNLKANFSINDSADCNPLKVVITNKSVPDGLFYRWMTNNTVIDTMKNPVLFFRNQSHTSNSQYKLKLLVTSDNAGCIDSIEKTLTVYPTPRADFIGLPVCYGENTLLNNNTIHGTAPISLNIWNYGDNKIDTLQNAIHKYSESGTYNVNLKVTDKNKCSADTTKKVIVYSLPLPDFEVDSIGCMNENIKVNNKSEDVVSCYWDFGNNKTSVQNDPLIVFNKSGCFQIKLISKNEYGCIDSIKNKIKIIVPPEAKFTKNIDSCCAPLDLIIFNKSTGENINYMWNLGNGVINSSMVDSIESIYGQGRNDTIYHIKLNVANICGSSSYIDSVKVKSNPVSILGANIKWSCSPAVVEFSNNLSYGNPDTFIWIWGDSTASYKTNKYTMQFPIKHTYYVNGDKEVIYKPMLIAINNCGSDTISKNITVYPQNVFAFFETDSSSGCQPFTTQFKNYSKGYQNIFWDFGDNTSPSNEISPKHTYNKSGDYVVSLIAKGSCGQDTARTTISVKSLPLIDFKCKDSVCINEIDSFTNVSKSILSFYKWDFGESNIITDNANPTQIFKQAGLRNITLYGISAISNCTGSLTKSILVKPAPVSTIIKSKINGCTPLNIDFRGDTGSHHFWDFNNGNTSNLINPSTIFNENGTYNVKLISMLDNGCSDTSNTTVNVFQSPIADFDEKFDSLCEIPLDVKFINNSVYTDSCHWIFGNGIMSKNKDLINMSFDTAGFYTNTLICYNNFGCTDTIKKTLNVYPAPKAAFDVLNNEGCKQLLVKFINKSKNSLYSYWDFGDNNSSEEMSPVKLYKDSGNYSVRLIATGNLGCSDTIVKKNSIVVYPKPHAEFVYEPINDPVDNSGKIKFNNLSKYSLIYLWDLGDGTTETSFEPLHRYYMYGTYNVILYAENSFNCRDTVSQEIKVDNFKGLFIANAFSPDHGSPDVRKFKPRGVGLKSYHIWIYDTWGNVIWESDKLDNTRPAEGWDGTINGNPVMQSVFVWKVEATFEDGSAWLGKKYENGKYLKYGSVTLIR
ncbi:MAG: PKD domain-containing protein [Bacteroidota bacterium]|nr:PKD domain-containing protein [Bacteroidota bacterium]